MSNFVLVLVVFIIGMGWGAAAMVIPMRQKIESCAEAIIALADICEKIAETQDAEVKALRLVSKDCGGVISGTKGVIESVDKLIEEIGNEV